jgi:YVTN family beta-propeller protein
MKNMKTLACTAVLAAAACGSGGPTTVDLAQRKARNLVAWAARTNIYAATGTDAFAPAAARARHLVYVPNSLSGTVSVIDPTTYEVLRTFRTGALPQHVVPAHDLDTLWVANNDGNSLTAIDPFTGLEVGAVRVDDPYNLYFTPDGRLAIVVAEKRQRLDFRDPHTMRLIESVRTKCDGIDHMEFSPDGAYLIATCEFDGQLVKIDLATRRIVGYLTLDPENLRSHAMPQDIRSSADGRVFFVADMMADGVWLVDPDAFQRTGFIHTGRGAHGIMPSRDGTRMYVTNRGWHTVIGGRHGEGSVSVVDPAAERVIGNWPIPEGGSPDMGSVSPDGTELWVSGRYDDEVYVFDTRAGRLTHRIKVGWQPHGLSYWPQPGRYSLGHTGNMR